MSSEQVVISAAFKASPKAPGLPGVLKLVRTYYMLLEWMLAALLLH